MKEFTVLRSESKLNEISPSVRELFDRKMSAIVARKEEEQQEVEKVEEIKDDLLKSLIEQVNLNSKDIQKLKYGIDDENEEAEIEAAVKIAEEAEREELRKGLELAGLDCEIQKKRKRVKI